jgi:hypothetical protein
MNTGSCLCGAVKYEVRGPLRDVIACHCVQCRKQTGTYMSATAARNEDLRIVEDHGLKWYRSSESARRGFCAECGSVMFWKGDGRDYTSIAAGSLDGQTGLSLAGHIFCASAGDYYEIAGGSYRHETYPGTGDIERAFRSRSSSP